MKIFVVFPGGSQKEYDVSAIPRVGDSIWQERSKDNIAVRQIVHHLELNTVTVYTRAYTPFPNM